MIRKWITQESYATTTTTKNEYLIASALFKKKRIRHLRSLRVKWLQPATTTTINNETKNSLKYFLPTTVKTQFNWRQNQRNINETIEFVCTFGGSMEFPPKCGRCQMSYSSSDEHTNIILVHYTEWWSSRKHQMYVRDVQLSITLNN